MAVAQNAQAALGSMPEADVLIYVSPQRILNEAAPRVVPAKDIQSMRDGFVELKKSFGVDPSTVEYLVFALRFHKPNPDLSFVAPDIMAVIGGDFSSEALLSLGQIYLQDKVRVEKHGSKTITLMKIDFIAEQAQKNPILKPLTEIGVVPLTGNSIAIGNLRYLQSAIDAADSGTGRINPAALQSLLRDPNALVAASGTPLTAFAKSFGLLGLENTTREWNCNSGFGNFYAALTMTGTNFSVRGAMNADNPDTAKIINGLVLGLMQQGIGFVTDKEAQAIMQAVRMTTRDSEIIWEGDIPEKVVADFLKPAPKSAGGGAASPKPASKRPVRKKRTR